MKIIREHHIESKS